SAEGGDGESASFEGLRDRLPAVLRMGEIERQSVGGPNGFLAANEVPATDDVKRGTDDGGVVAGTRDGEGGGVFPYLTVEIKALDERQRIQILFGALVIVGGHAANAINGVAIGDNGEALARHAGGEFFPGIAVAQAQALEGAADHFDGIIVAFTFVA